MAENDVCTEIVGYSLVTLLQNAERRTLGLAQHGLTGELMFGWWTDDRLMMVGSFDSEEDAEDFYLQIRPRIQAPYVIEAIYSDDPRRVGKVGHIT